MSISISKNKNRFTDRRTCDKPPCTGLELNERYVIVKLATQVRRWGAPSGIRPDFSILKYIYKEDGLNESK